MSGGRVEVLVGRLIRVLSHSPLARPLPAVTLSALGLGGAAFVGLCATAPNPSTVTPPVLLPLTALARRLGSPRLPDALGDTLMDVSIAFCCVAVAASRRRPRVRIDILIGLLVGIAVSIKINAAFVALTWGTTALKPLSAASKLVIAPSAWRLAQLSSGIGSATARCTRSPPSSGSSGRC
jgi:hypothetical protein